MIDWNKVIVASDDDTVQVVCGKSIFFAVSRAAGIDRVVKTSTSGLVDTYTIYRTDGTVAGTITVTNGRVAEIHICSSYEYDAQTLIPTVANPQANTFYLVPSGTGNDIYDEWIYVNNAWEKFGSASIDLSNYVTKSELEEEVYFENEYESVNGLLDIKESSSTQTIKEAVYTYPPSLTGISWFEALILNKNLIYNKNLYISPATQNGVTFTVNDDGSISFSGTPTAEIDVHPDLVTYTLPVGLYTFSGGVSEDCYLYLYGSTLKSTGGDIPVQINANTRISIYIHINNTGTPVSGTFYPMFRLESTTDDTYIKPLYSNSMWADFGSSLLYGGYYDFVNAIRCVTHKHIDSYNGESLPGAWISDRDTYVEGTLPSTGASVTYELAEPEIEETTKTKWNKTLLDGETVILLNMLNAKITISLKDVSVKDAITKLNNDLGSMAFEDDAPSDNVEYVRKNGAWAVSSGGGGSGGQAVWGAIAGTLSQQTDLQNALDGKQDTLTFDNAPTENSNNPVKSGGIKTALDAKADTTSVYTKAEADALLANKADTDDLGDLATQDSVDFATQVTGKPSAFPPTEHNHDDRYYTETEVDTFVGDLQDQIDAINKFSIHICSSTEYDSATHIPTVTNPSENTFYLVPNGTGNDVYDEYIYTNNAWEKFGSARIDISQYYTKTQIDTLLDTKQNTLTFDSTPTANSNNPVKSSGILSAIGSAIANLHKIYSAITELGFAQSSYPKLKAVTNAMPEGSIGMFKQAEIDITDYDNYENIRNLVIFRNASHGIIVLGFSYFDDAHDMENYDYGLYYANYDPEWGYFQGFRKANRDPILYYENQSVYVGSNATIIRIPYGSSLDYNISPDTIVLNCTFANPSVITSNVTWRSYAGYILFTGTCTAATTANVTLGQKGN